MRASGKGESGKTKGWTSETGISKTEAERRLQRNERRAERVTTRHRREKAVKIDTGQQKEAR